MNHYVVWFSSVGEYPAPQQTLEYDPEKRTGRAALPTSMRELDVSITAEPFFRRLGFRVVRRQIKIYRNRAFKQAVMEKRLRRAG
mgnify:CR=1 FL=1